MDWDEPAVRAAAARLRLAADPRRRRQGAGALMGRGPGSSLEFHDYRDYQPGDDTRYLDASVYARSGQLVLRRHRQEVHPRLEVLLDASASMAASPAKRGLATGISALLLTLAEIGGTRPRLWLLGQRHQRPPEWRPALRAAGCGGGLDPLAAIELGAGSERLLVSDGLWPGGGQAALPRLAAGAGRICLIQVIDADEVDPQPSGPSRLDDREGGSADLIADDDACAAYRARFARHQDGWRSALAGRGSGLITCPVADGWDAALKTLLMAGVLEGR